MFMKKSLFVSLACMFGIMMMTGCSSGSSSMSKLAETYAKIADNSQKMYDAFEHVYSADKKAQERLLKKATVVGEGIKNSNAKLAAKASKIAEGMVGTEVATGVSPMLDIKVGKGVFRTVNATAAMANVVVEIPFEGSWEGSGYIFFVDKSGKIVHRTLAHVSENSFFVNFHVLSNEGTKSAIYDRDVLARTAKFVVVSRDEYNKGEIAGKKQKAKSEESDEVKVNGVKIVEGAGLAKTLGKFSAKDLYWGYNDDYGLSVTVGNVWIMIDLDDVTPKGIEVINAYDMEGDLDFSVKYINSSAKITNFEVQ